MATRAGGKPIHCPGAALRVEDTVVVDYQCQKSGQEIDGSKEASVYNVVRGVRQRGDGNHNHR
jgi:hypothetical protein